MNRKSVAVGAFVVVALAMAVTLVLALGKGRFFGAGQVKAVVWFDKNVKGLTVGAPVTFRGVPVGQVDTIEVVLDPATLVSRMPVTLTLSSDALSVQARGRRAQREAVQALINRGLVAQMVTQSLVTGQAMIDLSIGRPPAVAVAQAADEPLRIPQVGGGFDQLLEQVSELPLKDTVADLRATLHSVRQLADEARVNVVQVSQQATRTLKSVEHLSDQGRQLVSDVQPRLVQASDAIELAAGDVRVGMGELSAWVAPGSPTRNNLDGALRDMARSARSFSALVEDIEDQPNALIFGRSHDR